MYISQYKNQTERVREYSNPFITQSWLEPCGPLEWTALETIKSIGILWPVWNPRRDPLDLPSWRGSSSRARNNVMAFYYAQTNFLGRHNAVMFVSLRWVHRNLWPEESVASWPPYGAWPRPQTWATSELACQEPTKTQFSSSGYSSSGFRHDFVGPKFWPSVCLDLGAECGHVVNQVLEGPW